MNGDSTSGSGKGNVKAVEDVKQTHKSTHCGFLRSNKIVFGSVLQLMLYTNKKKFGSNCYQ